MTGMKILRNVFIVLTLAAVALATTACPEKGPAEKAGEKIDKAIDKTEDGAKDATKEQEHRFLQSARSALLRHSPAVNSKSFTEVKKGGKTLIVGVRQRSRVRTARLMHHPERGDS